MPQVRTPHLQCSSDVLSTELLTVGFTGYLTNATINGVIAQALDGATIILEHRFFGESNPYPDLSVKSLQVHTIEQAIEDLEYFARNVHLPMPGGDNVAPGKAPWILVGGSYPGALVSWAMRRLASPLCLSIAVLLTSWLGNPAFSSQVTLLRVSQSIGLSHCRPYLFVPKGVCTDVFVRRHFWRYYEPIREHMPKNCSADVQAVVAHVDAVLHSRDATKVKA